MDDCYSPRTSVREIVDMNAGHCRLGGGGHLLMYRGAVVVLVAALLLLLLLLLLLAGVVVLLLLLGHMIFGLWHAVSSC